MTHLPRTSSRLLATAGLSGLLVAAAGLPAMAATSVPAAKPTTAKAPGCPAGPLATAITGNPDVKAQATEGFYVFHDAKGYEIEATHPGKAKTVFSGYVTASKGFAKLDDVHLEKGDYATETRDHKSIAFRFTNFGGIDGIHAFGDCSAAVRFDLRINGKTASTTQVFLGKAKGNPTSVPFAVDRSRSVAGTPTTAPAPAAPTPAPASPTTGTAANA